MTLNEAVERAQAIWGPGAINVTAASEGGAYVDTITDTHVSLSRYHRLDLNGHVVCHETCSERERQLNAKPVTAVQAVNARANRPYVWDGSDGTDGGEPNSTQLRTLLLALDAMMQTTLTDNTVATPGPGGSLRHHAETIAQAHPALFRQLQDMTSFVDAALFASGDILFLRATK